MHLSSRVAACLFSAALLISSSSSHSTERNPISYFSEITNARVNTPSQRIHAHSKFDLVFDLHQGEQRVKLTLEPNHDVIQDGATISYLGADGTLRNQELIDRSQYKVFKGDAWVQHYTDAEWTNVGWARIMVQRDGAGGQALVFEGAFRVDGDHHHVQTKTHFMQTRHRLDPVLDDKDGEEYMVLWRDSDISQGLEIDRDGFVHKELKRELGAERSCAAEKLGFNSWSQHPIYTGMAKRQENWYGSLWTRSIFKRQNGSIDGQTAGNSAGVNLTTSIGMTAGCPTTRKVALVGVATDCTYTAAFNSSSAARANIISVINSASQQYEASFNITLGLQNLTISDAACPATPAASAAWNIGCSNNVTIQDRLNEFSAWRGQRNDNNAYWTLLSTCATGSAVGLAWLGQACVATAQVDTSSTGNETVSGANVVVRTSTEWQVIAHETGHTFGAVHDCTADTCADGTTVVSQQCCPLNANTCDAGGLYIMNPSTGPNIQKFSPCSIGNICSAIGRNSVQTSCLTANKDVSTITGSQCGNGIVEAGEDCDCGGPSGCSSNSCCNPTTCKFTTNSVCDPSNEDCCTNTCQLASSGTVCRASTGVCDPLEMCSGTAATCPADTKAPDGTGCGNSSSLSCASGQCTSRDLQCKTLMGSYTQGNDTFACSSSGCQISCASPEFGSNVCYSMQQNFLDGTSCQGGGKCANGQCSGSSVGKEIQSWLDHNKTLVIALASVIGALLILIVVTCCVTSYRRRSKARAARGRKIASPPNVPPTPTWNAGIVPHHGPQENGWWNNRGEWVQASHSWQQGQENGYWDERGNWVDRGNWVPPSQPQWPRTVVYG